MAGTFDFAPGRQVPIVLPPDPVQTISMNGWTFAAKPVVPYVKKFRVTLYGMRWRLQADGLFDSTTDPTFNARRLEQFYEANGVWDHFTYTHPHLGPLTCRFSGAVAVPAAVPNSAGLIDAFDVELVHHDPGY